MNIADVKRELSSDEKVLESAFKLETVYKKYKFIIWTVAIGLILFFAGRTAMQSMHEAELVKANQAFLSLQTNAGDAEALKVLKAKNPALYELYLYAHASQNKDIKTLAQLTTSKNSVISDVSKYAQGVLENKSTDSTLYKEMSIIEDAYLAIKSGDTKGANAKLDLIPKDSSLSMLASLLKHSTLKAK